MNENIDKEFTNQIIELENGWIETPKGIFTPNDEQGLDAYEVYEKWLYDKENPKPIEPTLEKQVELLQEENKKLKIEQEQQNEEILVSMLANTEMFEMVLGMLPMTLLIEDETKYNGCSKGICDIYTSLIEKGVKTINDVPTQIVEQVKNNLGL